MGSKERKSGKEKLNQVKANWTPDNHELFVDLCLEQVTMGNRPGTHLTREGWSNVLEGFHSMTGLNYEKTQLKNHWDITKKHWTIWHNLSTDERMKWDPNTRAFGASDQEWDEYLKEHPEAATFRLKELQFADKLDIVFAGTVDSEQAERQPRKNTKWLTEGELTTTPRRRKHENNGTETDGDPEHPRKHQCCTLSPSELPDGNARPYSNPERCNYDAVESRSVITVQSPPPKLCYSIEECIKCLDSVEELEQGSELYLFALDIFLKKEYREIFMNLKKSSTRIAWLERLQTVGPPLPLQ